MGAAHCYSVGDDPSRYTVTCGEHSLQRKDKNEVTLQVSRYLDISSIECVDILQYSSMNDRIHNARRMRGWRLVLYLSAKLNFRENILYFILFPASVSFSVTLTNGETCLALYILTFTRPITVIST